jgi:hypothetical protein
MPEVGYFIKQKDLFSQFWKLKVQASLGGHFIKQKVSFCSQFWKLKVLARLGGHTELASGRGALLTGSRLTDDIMVGMHVRGRDHVVSLEAEE